MNKWESYIHDVLDGRIVACRYVRQAVERFRTLERRSDLVFRSDRVERVINFFGTLKHFKNRHAGNSFELEQWQAFIIASIFGFYYRDSGRRLVQNVYIEIARKNGKTALCGGLGLYALVADGVAGAEVDLVANSKEQAKIAFEFSSKFAQGLNTKRKTYLRTYRDRIFFDMTDSKMHVFASDASRLDGFGASCYIIDEFHAAKDNSLKEVLQSSQGDREDPLGIIITTAGFDKMSVCYQLRTKCTEILAGVESGEAADRTFCIIYTQDEDDDLDNPDVWVKSNPNMGITVQKDFLRREINNTKLDPSTEVGIKTKNFNLWMDASEVWIPDKYLIEATHDELLTRYADEEANCYVGVDLSATSDLTAVSYLIPTEEGIKLWTDYYLPEEALTTKALKHMYKDWQRAGAIKITPGNVVDYDIILSDILDWRSRGLYYWAIGYDNWNATQFAINATNAGLPMQPYGQNIGNFNKPTKEMERLILGGRAKMQNNPINRYCYRNVTIKTDQNGNQKPDKSKSDNKIDGVISQLMALGVYLTSDNYNEFQIFSI